MGLDLIVEPCAAPGHEAEWRRLMERIFGKRRWFQRRRLSHKEVERLNAISIPPYKQVGAPRVGFDAAADAWIIAQRKAKTPEDIAATLKKFSGFYVLTLAKCDGVPAYSHGSISADLDETSFRGEFLLNCTKVLDEDTLHGVFGKKWPEAAVAYGRALLAAADDAERSPRKARRKSSGAFLDTATGEPIPRAEQLDIVRAAGRWFVFWGERGHPIVDDF